MTISSINLFSLSPAFSILLVLSMSFLGIEFFLRLQTRSSRRIFARNKRGESARFDDFNVVKTIEPHMNVDYLTPEFWSEMQFFTDRGSVEKTRTADGKLIINAKNFDGKHISVREGMRTTTDTPDHPTGRVLFLGGSTVYCFEVPDSLTIASYLQRFLNFAGLRMQVLNLGVSGATTTNRIDKLLSMGTLTNRDTVIILFGVNDVGWQNYYLNESLSLKVLRNLRKYSLLLSWVYFEISSPRRIKVGASAAHDCAKKLLNLSAWLDLIGVRHKFIVQPNIYTKILLNEYESEIVHRFGTDFSQIVKSAYAVYNELHSYPFTSASNLMDDTGTSVYLDWSHVNATGNELIARFVSELEIFANVDSPEEIP